MSITRLRRACGALLGVAWLAGCSGPPPGPMNDQTRTVDAFHAIELRGSGEAFVKVGKPQALVVSTQQSAHSRIVTRVQDGKLIVENVKGNWYHDRPTLRLQIDVPALDAVTLSGGTVLAIDDMTGPRLALSVKGAGSVRAAGEVSALKVQLDGAGSMDLTKLQAGDASVTVNGTGEIRLHVTGQLEATVNGVGNVKYAGNPREVVRHMNGIGSISPTDGPAG